MENHTLYKMHISKLNEVYLKIETDSGIAREMSDYFTFEVPGARFMPAYRNKIWDGKIRLFSAQSGKIYFGLLTYIEQFCKTNEIEYTVDGDIKDAKFKLQKDTTKDFIESLRPTSKGKLLDVRDYQIDAIHSAIRKHRGLFLSPTASGKSLIIYALVRYYDILLKEKKILILVPTTSLVEQMYSDFIDYGWSDDFLHRIYAGHERESSKSVYISTWQSLYKMKKPYFSKFGCVIGDEAHLFKSKSLTNILTKLDLCKYRFGLTGTLDDTQTHRLVLEGLFGSVEKVITTKELIDSGTLADLEINCIVLKHTEEESKSLKGSSYAEEINYLVGNVRRNNFIINLSDNLEGNTLCLFSLVLKHGKNLYEEMEKFDRKVFFVYGGTDAETREKIRAITEGEKNAIIVASYGTFSTGVNIRNLHNIVFTSPSKSKIRVLQSLGRGLRKSESKRSVRLFDIADDLSYKSHKNFTLNHFYDRINIYNTEKFNHKIDKIKL